MKYCIKYLYQFQVQAKSSAYGSKFKKETNKITSNYYGENSTKLPEQAISEANDFEGGELIFPSQIALSTEICKRVELVLERIYNDKSYEKIRKTFKSIDFQVNKQNLS